MTTRLSADQLRQKGGIVEQTGGRAKHMHHIYARINYYGFTMITYNLYHYIIYLKITFHIYLLLSLAHWIIC